MTECAKGAFLKGKPRMYVTRVVLVDISSQDKSTTIG
jgi:hypothetical protein